MLLLVALAAALGGCAHPPAGAAAMESLQPNARTSFTGPWLGPGPDLTLAGARGLAFGKANGVGTASYYGRRFAGNLTANGERFDPSELTAAHRTLPFGSRVLVTNLNNGRHVTVRINDRGPFVASRVIDLSRRAARRLGMLQAGIAKVRILVLSRGTGE